MRWQSQLEGKQERAEFEKYAVENNKRTMRSIPLEMLSQDDYHMYVDPWILNLLFKQKIHKSLPDTCMLKNAHSVTHYQREQIRLPETLNF